MALLGGLLTGLAPFVVVLLFGLFGPLTPENRAYSAEVLAALGLAVLPWGVNTLFLRGLYALGRVREAVTASALVFLLNTLGYWLLRDAGLFLLNLSTALAGWVGLFLYLALLRREGLGWGTPLDTFSASSRRGFWRRSPGWVRERLPRLRAQGGAASPPPGRGRGGGPLPLRRGFAGPTRKGALERRAGAL